MHDFIQEAKRLLKPNAILAIVEIVKKETPFGSPFNIRYSPQELKKNTYDFRKYSTGGGTLLYADYQK